MGNKSYSKGISWIDDCRIPSNEVLGREQKSTTSYAMLQGGYNDGYWDNTKGLGRFPANLLVSDDMLNDGVVSKGIKSNRGGAIDSNSGTYSWNEGNTKNVEKYLCGFNDKGSSSRYYDIDKWFDNLING
jgi:hypothetical protein